MRKILCLVLTCGFGYFVAAQDETIVTDRPTQSAAAFVMPKGGFQAELGFLSEKVTDNVTSLTYSNLLLRWGAFQGVELRLTQNLVGLKIGSTTISGLSPLTLGAKVHLADENGLLPQISVIGQSTVKSGKDEFQPPAAIQELRFNFQNTVNDVLGIGYNVGLTWSDGSSSGLYTFNLGFSLGDGWTVFAEPYGFFGNGLSDHRVNAGVIYLLSNQLQADISAGLGLSDVSPDSFVGFGVAYLF